MQSSNDVFIFGLLQFALSLENLFPTIMLNKISSIIRADSQHIIPYSSERAKRQNAGEYASQSEDLLNEVLNNFIDRKKDESVKIIPNILARIILQGEENKNGIDRINAHNGDVLPEENSDALQLKKSP